MTLILDYRPDEGPEQYSFIRQTSTATSSVQHSRYGSPGTSARWSALFSEVSYLRGSGVYQMYGTFSRRSGRRATIAGAAKAENGNAVISGAADLSTSYLINTQLGTGGAFA
jgi:hypothetical protein